MDYWHIVSLQVTADQRQYSKVNSVQQQSDVTVAMGITVLPATRQR